MTSVRRRRKGKKEKVEVDEKKKKKKKKMLKNEEKERGENGSGAKDTKPNALNWKLIALFCTFGAFFLSYTAVKPFLDFNEDDILNKISFYEQQAMSYFEKEEWEKAVDMFDLADPPLHAMSYNTLGICLQKLNRTNDAIGAFRKAIEHSDQNEHPFRSQLNLARLIENQNDKEAIAIYERIVREYKRCIKEWSTVSDDGERVVADGPASSELSQQNASLCDALKEKGDEYTAFKEIVVDASGRGAVLLIENEEIQRAMQLLKSGMKVEKDDAKIHFLLGRVYLTLEDPRAAATHFEHCSGVYDTKPTTLRFRAACSALLHKMRAIQAEKAEKTP
eukprot:g873.t1